MPIYHYHRQILETYNIRAARMVRRRPVPESLAHVQADAAELSKDERLSLLAAVAKHHSKAEAKRLESELFPNSPKTPAKGLKKRASLSVRAKSSEESK